MATVILTIGNRSNDSVNISSVAGVGPYTVTLASAVPVTTVIGDVLSDEAASPKVFLITGISGSDLTVKDVLGAGAAPDASGTTPAFTRRAFAGCNAALNNALNNSGSTIFGPGDTADLQVCEEIVQSTYPGYPGQPQSITGGSGASLALIKIHGHADYQYTGGREQSGDAGFTDTDGRNCCLHLNTAVPSEIYRLVLTKAGASYNENFLLFVEHTNTTAEIHHNIVVGNGLSCAELTYYLRGISGNSSTNNSVLNVHNNIIRKLKNATANDGSGLYLGTGSALSAAHNNSVYDCGLNGIIGGTQGQICRNNIATGTNTADFVNQCGGSGASDYNISEDATAPGANSSHDAVVADLFVDADNGDLHHKAGSIAIGAGITLTGSVGTDINIDIDGETRAEPWDIGADFAVPDPLVLSKASIVQTQYPRQVDSVTFPAPFFMAESADHDSGALGLTISTQLRKPGGQWAPAQGSCVEVGGGWYEWQGHAGDRDTAGDVLVSHTADGADPVSYVLPIVSHDPWNAGGGGTATVENQQAIIAHLTGIKGPEWTPEHALDHFIELDDLWSREGKVRTTPPTDTEGLEEHIAWLSHIARHKILVDKQTGVAEVYDEAGVQVIGTATVSDDGTIYIRDKVNAPS